MRIVLLGNSGSGKSTMARRLAGRQGAAVLALDDVAWREGTERRPFHECRSILEGFFRENGDWVVEGCYGTLVEEALSRCQELRFLNPGTEACVAHCRRRPWEPDKFDSAAEQDAMLDSLLEWVRSYETRDDEFGYRSHRRIYDAFDGPKREYRSVAEYED